MWHTAFFELMSGLVISRMIYFLIGVAVLYDADAPLNSYHYLFNKTGISLSLFLPRLSHHSLSLLLIREIIGMDMMKYMCIKTFTVYGIKYPALCLIKIVQAKITGELERPEFDYFDLYGTSLLFSSLLFSPLLSSPLLSSSLLFSSLLFFR